jgi:hypothetical protein
VKTFRAERRFPCLASGRYWASHCRRRWSRLRPKHRRPPEPRPPRPLRPPGPTGCNGGKGGAPIVMSDVTAASRNGARAAIGSQPLAGSHAPRLGVSAGLEPKRRLTARGLIARQGRKQGALASTIASQHGNASPHKWGCGAEAGASAGAHRQRTWRESAEDWPEKAGAVAGPAAYRWRVAADRAGEVAQSATNAGRALVKTTVEGASLPPVPVAFRPGAGGRRAQIAHQ